MHLSLRHVHQGIMSARYEPQEIHFKINARLILNFLDEMSREKALLPRRLITSFFT